MIQYLKKLISSFHIDYLENLIAIFLSIFSVSLIARPKIKLIKLTKQN